MFSLEKSLIDSVDLERLRPAVEDSDIIQGGVPFFAAAGDEHYKLLAYISILHDGVEIFDIGTSRGASALALSYNLSNRVYTFDIQPLRKQPKASNIEYCYDNLMEPVGRSKWEERLLQSPIIFFDIDPHEGILEYEFFQWLNEKKYEGLLICDDIRHFKTMRDNFWDKIPSNQKLDITNVGHWSGTGVVQFTGKYF